jgi:hypothetical protein
MSDIIRVQPASCRIQAFAVWAIEQTPKIRTVGHDTFGVPADLFGEAPEEILIGALVDGSRYISPDEAQEQPPALPFREAVPGGWLPDVPEAAYGPDAVPLAAPDFAPLEDAPAAAAEDEDEGEGSDSSDSPAATEAAEAADESSAESARACEDCGRPYATERGLARHRRRVHSG